MMSNLAALTALFQKLGAPDPEGWARSQLTEGTDQLSRFVFLRQAWRKVLPANDTAWIEAYVAAAERRPDEPGAGAGHALKRLLADGANREDLHTVARTMQWELLHGLCYLLDDPGILEPEIEDLQWALVRVDEEGNSIGPISVLHESVLETDPTGREMRPT